MNSRDISLLPISDCHPQPQQLYTSQQADRLLTTVRPMLRLRTLAIASGAVSFPILYLRSRVLHLEQAYPPLPVETTSTPELRTSKTPGVRTAYVDVYGARVPAAALRRSCGAEEHLPLEELWPKVFLRSRLMKLEAKLAGGGSTGDLGEHGFHPRQKLLAGIMRVVRTPAKGTPLLVDWEMPVHLARFFERLAAWGYPWRLMEGGRHEWSVGHASTLPGESEEMVEVRFSAAHDYRVVEGEKGEGKVIPQWVVRAHRAYSRALLDQAVEEVKHHA